MSENDNVRDDKATGRDTDTENQPTGVPDADDASRADAVNRVGQAATEAIPGEDPEDDPDAESEQRFDAG